MNEILKSALNRGAPIDTPILINLYEFLELFESEQLVEEYKNCSKEIISKISNIIDMYGGNIILPTYATIVMGKNNSKELRFSGENYFLSIINLLTGISDNKIIEIYNDLEKFKGLKKQVLQIKSPEELRKKLPIIYGLYKEQLECNKNFLELEKLLNDKDTSLEIKLENLSKVTNNFKNLYSEFDLKREQQFAKDFTLSLYLERIMQAIETMLINAEEIVNIYCNYTLDIDTFNKEDAEKLNLYIAAKFMEQIEDKEDKQRYLFYLTNYFKENVETQVTRVKIKLNGKKVNPISLYKRYQKILVENPELLAVNFSYTDFHDMTKEEAEEFIIEYLKELAANWELLPHDDTSVERTVKNIAKRKVKNISEEERKQREEKLLNLFMQKKKFYDQTDPYFRIKGKQTFDGYVGYIYSNALVILEKFYDNVEKTKIAENEAIYIIGMKDFYDLSQHSKTYLMASPLCKRIIHKGAWQERVLEYINKKDLTTNPSKDTQKLILEKKVSVNEKML